MTESVRQRPPAVRSTTAFARLARQPALAGALLAVTAAAWVATDLRMAGMDAGPGTNPGALGFYLSTWVVMMAAMMLPAVAPMTISYRELQHERRGLRRGVAAADTALFLTGYLVVWVIAGLLAYTVLEGARSLDGGLFAWNRVGRWTATAVLGAAALYQLTPAKQACLIRCRSQRAFLLGRRRDSRAEALQIGLEHGAWCLGCCWALMAALFALGAMSLSWMALISVAIAAERLLPWRALAAAGIASLLAAVAIGFATAPTRVPLLTVPGHRASMQAMGSSPPTQMHMP